MLFNVNTLNHNIIILILCYGLRVTKYLQLKAVIKKSKIDLLLHSWKAAGDDSVLKFCKR